MPQARLPDINAAFTKYRNEAIISWKGMHYDSAVGSLYAFNGLLPGGEPPNNYRIKISTQEFNDKTKTQMFVTCGKCEQTTEYKIVKIFDMLLSLVDQVVTGNEYSKAWICPSCKATNELLKTKVTQKVRSQPYFLKIVPAPPERKHGIMDRITYHIKFSVWFWSFLDELEAQAAQFRDDNWQKKGEMYDDSDIQNSDAGEGED